jgi:hypothetical protein
MSPASLWLCQEASGNLADSIGSLTLTAAGTPSYQQAEAGWTRLALTTATGGAHRFSAAAANGPSPATTSSLWIWYGRVIGAPAGARDFAGLSNGATSYRGIVTVTPRIASFIAGVTVTGTSNPGAQATGPLVLQYDRTGARAPMYTIQEKIAGTYNSGVVDGLKGWGAIGGTGHASALVYGVMFSGANGEMTEAQVRALLSALGFAIPW